MSISIVLKFFNVGSGGMNVLDPKIILVRGLVKFVQLTTPALI